MLESINDQQLVRTHALIGGVAVLNPPAQLGVDGMGGLLSQLGDDPSR